MQSHSFLETITNPTGKIKAYIIAALVGIGALLRIRQYLTGRSLWLDEAMLALNIVNRNFIDLFHPLDYDQGSPIGFLLVEKFFNLILGRNEFALRLFPLILGLLSLWTFLILVKQFSNGYGLILGMALFALNPKLIYYSSEVKQYIGDVAVTIVVLLLAARYFEKPAFRSLGILTLAGCLALWLSHPALFVLAGVGFGILITSFKKRDYHGFIYTVGMGCAWLVNTGVLYSLTLGDLQGNPIMREYWQGAFAPAPPWSNWSWYWSSFRANADFLFSVSAGPLLLLLLFITGWILLFRQDRNMAGVLIFIMVFALLASSLELYPSHGRLGLYLLPIGILLAGLSIDLIQQTMPGGRIGFMVVLLAVFSYLFWGTLPQTMEQFISPKYFEHIRPTMQYLQRSWKPGDEIYVSYGAVPAFEFYSPLYGLEDVPFTHGERSDYEEPSFMIERIQPLADHERVWFLFSHVYARGDFNEMDYLVDRLKKSGKKIREYREPGTSVFLFLFDLHP